MSHQTVVIGAGIVGLATAREILLQRPGTKLTVLEKEPEIAQHQTGHNSGVIHSGIYYKPGSQKSQTCREGIGLMREFCDKHAIKRKRVGKVIVIFEEKERAGLKRLYEQGAANKVPGLREISQAELREIEPAIKGIAALHLPEVEIVDYKAIAAALKKEIEERGGEIHLHDKVTRIESRSDRVVIHTKLSSSPPACPAGRHGVRRESKDDPRLKACGDDEGVEICGNDTVKTHEASFYINCAGLYSDKIAQLAGARPPTRIIPFRGEYYYLSEDWAKKIRGLVYVIPDPRFPFLGVHLTPTLEGRAKAGPNAVLALAREGYSKKDINLAEIFDMAAGPHLWRMMSRYWKMGMEELVKSYAKGIYASQLARMLPDIKASDLLPGPTGVRAQAVEPDGRLADDFLYIRSPQAIHVLNSPSPAATASLAIAKRITALI